MRRARPGIHHHRRDGVGTHSVPGRDHQWRRRRTDPLSHGRRSRDGVRADRRRDARRPVRSIRSRCAARSSRCRSPTCGCSRAARASCRRSMASTSTRSRRAAPTAPSSEILANVLLDEVICRAAYHIDLHAGDLGEMLLPFAGYALTGNRELDDRGEALARLYSPKLISLATSDGTIPPFADGIVLRRDTARSRLDLRRVRRKRHAGGARRPRSRRWRDERHAISSHDRRRAGLSRGRACRRATEKSFGRRGPDCFGSGAHR